MDKNHQESIFGICFACHTAGGDLDLFSHRIQQILIFGYFFQFDIMKVA